MLRTVVFFVILFLAACVPVKSIEVKVFSEKYSVAEINDIISSFISNEFSVTNKEIFDNDFEYQHYVLRGNDNIQLVIWLNQDAEYFSIRLSEYMGSNEFSNQAKEKLDSLIQYIVSNNNLEYMIFN